MLIKLDPEASTDIFNYCQEQYDKAPFIIQRDDSELNYKIITDYDQTRDYVLIIENEVNDDLFIVVNQDNKKPFIFSENPKFRDQLLLFLNNEHNTIALLNSVFKFDIDPSMSFNRVISMLLENNVSIVYNNRKIYGFIYNNVLLSIPSIFYDTSNITGKIELKFQMMNCYHISRDDNHCFECRKVFRYLLFYRLYQNLRTTLYHKYFSTLKKN